jgi:hypothetical protein
MERLPRLKTGLFCALAAAGVSGYLTTLLQSGSATVLSHGLKLRGGGLALFAGIAVLAFAAFAIGASKYGLQLAPVLFLLLTPLLNVHYWTREDLRARLAILGLAVLAALLYVRLASIVPLAARAGGRLGTWRARIAFLPLKRKLVLLFFAAFLVFNLGAFILVSEGMDFSGDEPTYLISADSLFYDRDINLADNFARQDYFHFYDRERMPDLVLNPYTREGRKGSAHQYPINLPGISFLMLPWYALGQLIKGRWLTFLLKGSLAVWAALLGTQIFLLVRERFKREGLALGIWAVSAFSAPLVFYATHLYPEIPIALFSVYIFRKMTSDKPPIGRQILFMGFLLGTFFWFGVKYNFIFGPLVLVSCHALWFRHKMRSKLPVFLALPILGAAVFYGAVYWMYGTFSPMAVYEGIQTPEHSQALLRFILAYPLSIRLDSFLDYFLDQRDGLLLYAPVYAFALLGFVHAWRKRKSDLWCALLVAGPFLFNYAFFTHRQGVCPPGRVLAPLVWIGALLLAYFVDGNRNRIFAAFFGIAAAASIAEAALLHFHPLFLYQPTTHEVTERAGAFFIFLSNMRTFLPAYLPSFLKVPNGDHLPNYFWVAGLAFFVAVYLLVHKRAGRPWKTTAHLALACFLLTGIVWMWVWEPRTILYPTWETDYPLRPSRLGFYLAPTGEAVVTREGGRFYLHEVRPHTFVFASKEKLDKIKIVFGSETDEFEARVRFFDLPLTEGRTVREQKELVFVPLAAYRYKGRYFYELGLELRQLTPRKVDQKPYFFQILPAK